MALNVSAVRLPLAMLLIMASGGLACGGKAWGQEAEKSDFATDFANAANAAAAAQGRQTCEIVVQDMGVMAPNVGATKLSSLGYGGQPGKADVTTNTGSFYISIDRPNGFSSAPNGGNSDVTFLTSLNGMGKTVFSDAPGDSHIKLKNGLTHVEINLEATRQGSPFPAGRYRAELTLRCE